jgi:hypothetical protein
MRISLLSRSDLDDVAVEAAHLLLGVARLGDGDLRGWWGSAALSPDVGRFILSNTFPRTGRIVGAELMLISAARRHGQILSRPNAIHLFSDRMPFHRWTRAWLAEQKTGWVDHLIDELESWRDVTEAQERLAEWTGPSPTGDFVAGAIELGRIDAAELDDPPSLLGRARAMAACYAEMTVLTPAFFNLGR